MHETTRAYTLHNFTNPSKTSKYSLPIIHWLPHSLHWQYSLYRPVRPTVRLRFLSLFSLALLSLTMQKSCSFLFNCTWDHYSHSIRYFRNHTSLLCHLNFWKCKSCDYGYCCLVVQHITICASTLKRIVFTLQQPLKERGRYIALGIITTNFIIHEKTFVFQWKFSCNNHTYLSMKLLWKLYVSWPMIIS